MTGPVDSNICYQAPTAESEDEYHYASDVDSQGYPNGGYDYWADLVQLFDDNLLLKTFTLWEKWGSVNKFWLIMLAGSAMLYGLKVNKRFLKYVGSHVTSISSSIMTLAGKKTMKRALKEYENVGDGNIDHEELFPDIEPFMSIVEDYDRLLEHGVWPIPPVTKQEQPPNLAEYYELLLYKPDPIPGPANRIQQPQADNRKSNHNSHEEQKQNRTPNDHTKHPSIEAGKCNSPPCSAQGLHLCSKCMKIKYCSRECQVAHWKAHKPICVVSRDGKIKI